ncbi:hypothetical protein FA15DRAFT_659333 [Coprinopsis marcescibilis]|uniref:C2H2-type domain-containing protein n=1 Tax=Coprinopsis marcescibilis TaxID=230819 RepID=A0A5C3KIN9_COPMA|nr:hypothetical protein FA15DRAFT_659333 [Coprinopsis marcescibilis]
MPRASKADHDVRVHGKPFYKEDIPENSPLKCEQCNRVFRTERILKSHLLNHGIGLDSDPVEASQIIPQPENNDMPRNVDPAWIFANAKKDSNPIRDSDGPDADTLADIEFRRKACYPHVNPDNIHMSPHDGFPLPLKFLRLCYTPEPTVDG